MSSGRSHSETFSNATLLQGSKLVLDNVSGTLAVTTAESGATNWSGTLHTPLDVPCGEYRLVLPAGRGGTIRLGNVGETRTFDGVGELQIDLFEHLRSLGRLPELPDMAVHLFQMVQDSETTAPALADLISTDLVLVGQMLMLLNTCKKGLRRAVSNLEEAIQLIGLRGAGLLAASISVLSLERNQTCPSFNYDCFWGRSLAVAVAARVFAQQSTLADMADEAFSAGLLGRIGQLVLAAGMPDEYEEVLQAVANFGCDLEEAERDTIGATHSEIGMRLLDTWRLPEAIRAAIEEFLQRRTDERGDNTVRLAQLLDLADQTAEVLTETTLDSALKIERIADTIDEQFALARRQWTNLFDRIAEEWRDCGQILMIPMGPHRSLSQIESEARALLAEWTRPGAGLQQNQSADDA